MNYRDYAADLARAEAARLDPPTTHTCPECVALEGLGRVEAVLEDYAERPQVLAFLAPLRGEILDLLAKAAVEEYEGEARLCEKHRG